MDQPEIDRAEWTRRGIDVMMAWTQNDDDRSFAIDRFKDYANNPEGLVPLTVGLISLTGILLLRLTNGNRQKMREILREIAAQTV